MAVKSIPIPPPVPSRPCEAEMKPIAAELLGMSPAEMRQHTRRLVKAGNRLVWRRARQRRASFISALLRACKRALGELYDHRYRCNRTWLIYARAGHQVLPVISFEVPVQHRLDDFEIELDLEIIEPGLVDLSQLEQWQSMIRVGPARPQKKKGVP